jgi:hypothetical protein
MSGTPPMNAPNHNTPAKGLREWWASPPRSGLQRLIIPWEYRHLCVFGVLSHAAIQIDNGLTSGKGALAPMPIRCPRRTAEKAVAVPCHGCAR